MRLSKRGEYGLRAMITLAEPAGNGTSPGMMQIKDISQHEKISPKFLEQILLMLKNAGLLHSKMGVGGGYYLARSASEITLGQIFRVLDGPVAPVKCVSHIAYASCGLRLAMSDVRNAIARIPETHPSPISPGGRMRFVNSLCLKEARKMLFLFRIKV